MADRTMGGAQTQWTGLRENARHLRAQACWGTGARLHRFAGWFRREFSQRAFARLSRQLRGLDSSGARAAITINSSPTVVINAPGGER